MTTKTKDKTTPLQAARAYAEAHPEFEGEVRVTTWRSRAGGRWGWQSSAPTQQTSRVWVAGGRAALIKILRGKNGPCRACGRVILEPVLTDGYGPDERAGQSIPERDRTLFRVCFRKNPVYAAVCGLRDVCPECMATFGLTPQKRPVYPYPAGLDGSEPVIWEPARFTASDHRPPVVTIDLTKSGGEVVE